MHGCNSGTALLVNAEVDSMGGVIDGGVGIGLKTSPRRAAIEKAQAELRQEYDVREERRRELEFLEKGGNPLDFKFGNAASASVQSTSLTDQHHEQFGTSEAKGSFALTASPHGDSVDSSARPGAPSISEPNTADNLLIFDGENELPKGERRSQHQSRRNNIPPSEQSSQIDGSQNAKESEDSAIFRPYSRRRSKTSHGPRGGSRDGKGLVSETSSLKDHNLPSVSKPKPPNLNGDMITKDLASINPLASKLDGVRAHQTASGSSVPEVKLDISVNKNCKQDQCAVPSQDDTVQNPVVLASGEANAVEEREPVSSADLDSLPVATSKPENETCSGQPNGFGNIKVDRKGIANQGQNNDAALGMMNFNSESSCTQTSLGRDVNNDSDMCNSTKNVTANGITGEQASEFEKKVNVGFDVVKERMKTNASGGGATVNNRNGSGCQSNSGSGNMVKGDENMAVNNSSTLNKEHDFSNIKEVQQNDSTVSKTDKVVSDVLVDHSSSVKGNSSGRHHQGPLDVSNCELPRAAPDENVPNAASDCQPCSSHHLLADKAHEDSTLEEARIIEAKRKRIAELSSIRTLPTQNHRKSHWGFVLEEMAWLANDFAQERLWKITAAAQLCHRAAFTSRLRFEEQNKLWGIKVLAHSMAKAVMQFWRSVELLLDSGAPKANCPGGLAEPGNVDADEASRNKRRNSNMETSKDLEEPPRKNVALKVQAYALRFLKYSSSHETFSQAEAPSTPDRISDSGTLGMPWDEHLTEENLFYTVPSSAMETYRKSVEYHFLHFEKTGSSMQEEVETSIYDTAAEFGSEEHAYDEDDGETNTYYLPGVYEGSKPSKSAHKKHKNLMKSYTPRPCEVGADLHYGNYATGSQPSIINGKRPASLNVGPITKRMRTASRQRVVSPFTAGVTGTVQAQVKTDASSGDTNSFQDDQSTLHGGSQIQKSVEVESIGEFERQLPYDCAETSVKTKKKKKAKNLGSAYDQGWQVDSVLNEQRDHSKRRLESHHFEPNGSSGLYVQHTAKKPKTMKISLDNTFDVTTMNGSIPSPAASQMSNPSKFIKIISGRDRGRKAKSLKISAGQPGSGSPWSLFEDQALVVLVHDMGPNWELVSDAINSTLQFKCIFRKPKECKDRHKILMDRSAGDGADSAEDSGSSQSYPSTLPGIPKGSARQLFQRLQGPMEEDTLKSHFENIIKIGQKQYYRRNQNDIQDLKQIVPVHNSHVMALAQVCPNNLNGGLLTPLDLCDTNAPTPDALPPGYQSSHAGGLALSSQGSLPSIHPTSGANSSLPGSSGMVHGNNLSSPSGPMTASVRDIRYGVPRTSPLSVDEQQRMQYSQMISGRNIQQSSMSLPGSLSGSDRGVRMLQGGNGMGMMCGMNRSMGISRPGLQGMAPSSMLNSGNMLSSSMVGMPSLNMHSGVGTGQGNSMLRPREALHMMRPGHNPEQQRQMMVPDLPMQASQGNSQGIPAFNGLSSAFNNQTTPPPVQPYPGHSQQPHQMSQQQSHLNSPRPHLQGTNHSTNSPQQALAIRIAKERQMQQHQQRYLQQQNQPQFAASNTLMPHVQAQSQIPISSPPQNSSQIQSQNSSPQVSASPVTSSQHPQQKHHLPQHGFNRNPSASGLTNQAAKQRQRQTQQQQYQQPGRQHPNQRQHVQSQQQAKLLKGIGRGNMLAHQNISVDSSHLNGLSTPLTSQNTEKGDPTMHIMQGQNLYPESGLNSNQPSKPLASAHSTNHSQLQQKLHSVATTTSSKQHQPMVSPDNSAQGQISAPQSGPILPPSQPAVIASNHHPVQLQSHSQSKQISQTQSNVQRMLQQNRLVHSESPSKSQSDQTQVDRQSANNTSEVSTSSAMTQGRVDSANVVSVPADSSQWKTSESSSDSSMPNKATQVGSLGSAPVGNSAGKEHLPPTSQGLCSRQLPVNLPSHSHNSGAQWSQQPLPSQQSSSQPTLSQQQYKPQEQQQQKQQEQEKHSPKHVALQHQSQQQVTQGQSSLFIRPPNSRVE